MLMSSDVSGIPSFLPPARIASLWEHTLRSLAKTRTEQSLRAEETRVQRSRARGW